MTTETLEIFATFGATPKAQPAPADTPKDTPDDSPVTITASVGKNDLERALAEAAGEFCDASAEVEQATARRKTAAAKLQRYGIQQAGSQRVTGADGAIYEITRDQTYSWDRAGLMKQLDESDGAGELPACVQRTLTISRAKYDAMSPDEQERLHPFLTKKVGPAKATQITPASSTTAGSA